MANKYSSFKEFSEAQARNLAEIQLNTVVREAAIITGGEIKKRIENEGKSTFGQMQSKSQKRLGAYSLRYGKMRQKKGAQTGIIDLNMTELMWRNWRPIPTKDCWGVTFVSATAMNRAMWNEQRFGAIFEMTAKELKIGEAKILRRVRQILKRS